MGTSMKVNRQESGNGGSGSAALTFYELEGTINVPSNATLYLPLDVGSHRFEVKTVKVTSNPAGKVSIRIEDRPTGGEVMYESLVQSEVHDIVGVPIIDRSGQQRVHAFVNNGGNDAATLRVVIKVIPYAGGN